MTTVSFSIHQSNVRLMFNPFIKMDVFAGSFPFLYAALSRYLISIPKIPSCIENETIAPDSDIGMMIRVFANNPEDLGSIPSQAIPKTQKWYLMPLCLTLSIIRLVSRVKWSNPEKGVVLLQLAIENGALGSPSTTVANFTLLLIK